MYIRIVCMYVIYEWSYRKRPWPSCPNPETGNEWSHDMKENIVKVLQNTKFEVVYAPQNIQAVDDPSLRQVLGTYLTVLYSYTTF